ncbi:T9SS type B sorting domain-containing protein [Flavobacterium orientale]|nr:T9SS type B sorting domain-containing protein [Flavobacterium orientale]
MKKIAILFLLMGFSVFAQFSKTHYIPPLSGSDGQPAQNQFLYISCPNLTPVNFTITVLGGNTINGTVSRDNPYILSIGFGTDSQLHVSKGLVNTILDNKGYVIEAEDQVYVAVRLTATPQNFQAGGLVSKGLAALGTQFRIGAFVNTGISGITLNHYTFVSILATENNTTINFSDIKPGVSLINNAFAGNNPNAIILNRGETFVMAVDGPTNANRDGLIGSLVSSDKPIAVNCGSYAGTNGNNDNNIDLGFDQIVSAERTGNQYIFIKGFGETVTERPLIVAHEDNTQVFLNNNIGTPDFIINAGDYLILDGNSFSANDNLYVQTSKNVFAYQGVGGSTQANQELYFVPPLSCQTPKIINNIPFLDNIGGLSFTENSGVNLVTKTGATLEFIINGITYTYDNLPQSIFAQGPFFVDGNPEYVTYKINGLGGNVSVFSTDELYLSYYGSSGAATYGGFYSGFTFRPEITFNRLSVAAENCIPNINLTVNSLSPFDSYQWYYNDAIIDGATNSSYTPTQPGYYYLKAAISNCGLEELISDKIPVSACPNDMDNDGVNDNIDIDNDNDGISNCVESFGDASLDLTSSSNALVVNSYFNSYNGLVTTNGTETAITPFTGTSDGLITTETAPIKENSVTYNVTFAQPLSVALQYPDLITNNAFFSSDVEYTIQVPTNHTLTVLDPDGQLLIDTNYDGIFENNVTGFSTFELRFRLNSGSFLTPGTATFKIQTYLTEFISITHKNLTDEPSKSTLQLIATCVPKDSDADGIPDQIDLDSDNDGIPDVIESQGIGFVPYDGVDTNGNGMSDAFEEANLPIDSDGDGVPDYLDLDSDNDGIYDLVETGLPLLDVNNDGRIDGLTATFGINGLFNAIETFADSGILNYTPQDTDNDGVLNYLSLDSDGDLCFDVIEAGFLDSDNNGRLGTNPIVVNANGVVLNNGGYISPNSDYLIGAPIEITTQPQDVFVCELQNTSFTIEATLSDSYQWQVSTDATTWTDLTNNVNYSGVTTVSLQINNVTNEMNGNLYRIILNRNGNSCGLISEGGILTIYPLPTINSPVNLVQCDDDTDGISAVNLRQKENEISSNFANETFTYFTNEIAAINDDNTFLINDPIAYVTGNSTVWVRVVNQDGCFRVGQLNVFVSATQIPSSFLRTFVKCDDFIDAQNDDRDGVSQFDFSNVTAEISALLPATTPFTIKYYKTLADALAETNTNGDDLAIDPSNYRNIGFPNFQQIWVRVESNLDNACFGLGPYIELTVEALPLAPTLPEFKVCDDNQDGLFAFDTSNLNSSLLNGQNQASISFTFTDSFGTTYLNELPNPFVSPSQIVTVRMTNTATQASDGPCFDETELQFTVDIRPIAFPVTISASCDTDGTEDGFFGFNTTNIQTTLLGNQTGMDVSYFDSSGQPLSSPLPNPFITNTQTITAVVTNPLNTNCPASTPITFTVHPLPQLAPDTTIRLCKDTQTTINAGLLSGNPQSFTYQWFYNTSPITGGTRPTLNITENGIYTIIVTSPFGCIQERNIIVLPSEPAIIEEIQIIDLVDINSVTILVSGTGDYVYSLTSIDGPYQESNVFTNVAPGIYTVFIKDINDCGIVTRVISVLGIPKFFTPNGDGYNDTWNIKGVSDQFNKNSILYIYDRYGKLVKQLTALSSGWDGIYNGQPLPSTDYWYVIELEDGRIAKGHFSLKR